MLSEAKLIAVRKAVKTGSLHVHEPKLDAGQTRGRYLWLRPEVHDLVQSGRLDPRQQAAVHAAFKRFVVGGPFTVVTPGATEPVAGVGDIKVLDHVDRLTVELRFKPPRFHLRLFGRFIDRNALVLTSFGMKALQGAIGERPLVYADHYARCETFFSSPAMRIACPQEIRDCITSARFLDARS